MTTDDGSHRLRGEIALVTGSTRGIGREIALRFAQEGARVAVTGRDASRGENILRAIKDIGGAASFHEADLSDEGNCTDLVEAVVEDFGGLTILVNNAAATAGVHDAGIHDFDTTQWNKILTVNLTAAAWLCRESIGAMKDAGHGSIVNISSRAAERGTPGHAAYTASKGGLNALTRSIAVDYAADNIRCNAISAGYILNETRDRDLTDDRRERLEGMHLTRLGRPEDIAWAAVYLACKESEFVTGITLPVDGGSTVARASSLG